MAGPRALEAPDRAFIVEQTKDGERTIRYREAREAALAIAEGLLGYELGPERPIAILAANCIDYALVILAAVYVGIPFTPIAARRRVQSG